MRLELNKSYFFNFAGSKIKGKYYKKDKLNNDESIYMFLGEDGLIYPVRKKNIICGNSKQ